MKFHYRHYASRWCAVVCHAILWVMADWGVGTGLARDKKAVVCTMGTYQSRAWPAAVGLRLTAVAVCLLLLWPTLGRADNELKSGVVRVTAGNGSIGTGFVVCKDDVGVWIVTASHVVKDDPKTPKTIHKVEFFGTDSPIEAEIKYSEDNDPLYGIALLRVANGYLTTNAAELVLGEDIKDDDSNLVIIGHPPAGNWSKKIGYVSKIEGRHAVLEANIQEGNSGGPVFKDGRVAGMVATTKGIGNGEAVQVSAIRSALEGWHQCRTSAPAVKAPATATAPTNSPKSVENPKPDCPYCPEMVRLPAGEFMMGAAPGEAEAGSDEQPRHNVKVNAFSIGKYEVTQGQWQAVMGSNPSYFKQCGDNCPVEYVSFNQVQAFIQNLNDKTGQVYRLPTEAEWEYAARAGTTTAFSTGNCINTRQANYEGRYDYNGCGVKVGDYLGKTTPVGSYPANPWGLYDMHGNVWEWTCSAYTERYDDSEEICTNDVNIHRGVRGGSWFELPHYSRSANRGRYGPNVAHPNIGFRLARAL